jgi:hypothetical protein
MPALSARQTIRARAQTPRVRLGLVVLALIVVLGLVAGGIELSRTHAKDGILTRLQERATSSADFVSTYVSLQAGRSGAATVSRCGVSRIGCRGAVRASGRAG